METSCGFEGLAVTVVACFMDYQPVPAAIGVWRRPVVKGLLTASSTFFPLFAKSSDNLALGRPGSEYQGLTADAFKFPSNQGQHPPSSEFQPVVHLSSGSAVISWSDLGFRVLTGPP